MSAAEHPMMHRALEHAHLAAQHDDVPVGCVVVIDGRIVGEGPDAVPELVRLLKEEAKVL